MRIAPIFTNSIDNKQNSQNTAFKSGLAINVKYPKIRGRDHKQQRPSRYLGAVEQFLRRKKNRIKCYFTSSSTGNRRS